MPASHGRRPAAAFLRGRRPLDPTHVRPGRGVRSFACRPGVRRRRLPARRLQDACDKPSVQTADRTGVARMQVRASRTIECRVCADALRTAEFGFEMQIAPDDRGHGWRAARRLRASRAADQPGVAVIFRSGRRQATLEKFSSCPSAFRPICARRHPGRDQSTRGREPTPRVSGVLRPSAAPGKGTVVPLDTARLRWPIKPGVSGFCNRNPSPLLRYAGFHARSMHGALDTPPPVPAGLVAALSKLSGERAPAPSMPGAQLVDPAQPPLRSPARSPPRSQPGRRG